MEATKVKDQYPDVSFDDAQTYIFDQSEFGVNWNVRVDSLQQYGYFEPALVKKAAVFGLMKINA